MTQQLLADIAKLMSGQAFKGSLQDDPDGDYLVLGSDAIKKGTIDSNVLIRRSRSINQPFKFIETGDVLIAAKSNKHRAFVFERKLMDTVASSYFQIVRIKNKNRILPSYIAWFINHPMNQEKLTQLSSGTTVKNLRKGALEKFNVVIPPLRVQQHVIDAAGLAEKKIQILDMLKVETENYWNITLMNGLMESSYE